MDDHIAATGHQRIIGTIGLSVVITVSLAFLLGLYALTPQDSRPELLDQLRPLLVAAVPTVPSLALLLVTGQVRSTQRQQAAATREQAQAIGQVREHVQKVDSQTNGQLDVRMADIIRAELDRRGLDSPIEARVVDRDVQDQWDGRERRAAPTDGEDRDGQAPTTAWRD